MTHQSVIKNITFACIIFLGATWISTTSRDVDDGNLNNHVRPEVLITALREKNAQINNVNELVELFQNHIYVEQHNTSESLGPQWHGR